MATETNKLSKTAKLIIGLLVVLVAILFWLVLRQPDQQLNRLLGDNVSIRQDQDNIQWKLPGSDWQTITTISALTGKDGQDGTAGKDGVNGQDGTDGKDGVNGAQGSAGATGAAGATGLAGQDGVDGVDGIQGIQGEQGTAGVDGQDGAQGIQGVQGDQGIQGEQGVAGANGQDGQDGTTGTDGREIELQKDIYYIQWRYVGEPGWRNLTAYSDLKGEKGDTGATGPANTLSIGTVDRTACTPTANITGSTPNQTLNLGIPGLPTGGTTGQVLQKNSNDDCDTVWASQNVIVGAGRPDVAETMDATTQAKVASAISGTEFRSTDGPHGAWIWTKQGSSWVVTQGDTGWIAPPLLHGWRNYGDGNMTVALRRINQTVWVRGLATVDDGARKTVIFELPLWARPSGGTVGIGDIWITGEAVQQRSDGYNYTYVGPNSWPVDNTMAWPTTLSL